MYLNFFKFRKNPFHITPDPEFLFLSPSHKEASASILYGIEQRKGFIAITGEVGVGKTTILRSYLEGVDPEKTRIVYIFNSALSFQKLLKQVNLELAIPIEDDDPSELVNRLFYFLIEEYKKDRNIVLIIDEAQNMPVETLERLRMLSNLETSQDKLIQIILVGQPEFEGLLDRPELRQLKQRVAIRCRIASLSAEESMAYIQHRLMKASSFFNPVFTKDALKAIVKESDGIPRIINVLCDNALITAFGYQRNPVDLKIVKEVIADLSGSRPKGFFRWRTAFAVTLMVLAGLLVFFLSDTLVPNEISSITRRPASQTSIEVKPEQVLNPGASSPGKEMQGRVAIEEKVPEEIFPKTEPEREIASATMLEKIEPVSSPLVEIKMEPSPPALPEKAPEVAEPFGLAQNETPKALTVKKGDSIFKLLADMYGRVDQRLVKSFKDLNPQIQDIDKVKVGEEILLPKMQKTRPTTN
ncbi:MAG: AAA family ATPase [Syntrophobacteraceae bacterium]